VIAKQDPSPERSARRPGKDEIRTRRVSGSRLVIDEQPGQVGVKRQFACRCLGFGWINGDLHEAALDLHREVLKIEISPLKAE